MIGRISCGSVSKYEYDFSGSQILSVEEIVPEGRLVLECNGVRDHISVQRGAPTNCAAKTDPQGGIITEARWTFKDTQGKATVNGPEGQNAWGGPMVVGGTITLSAKVNGVAQTATAAVTVTPRPWRDEVPELRTVHCPAGGVADCPLKMPMVHEMDVGQTTVRRRTTWSGRQILAGPNTGWYYLGGAHGPVVFHSFITYLHSELLNPRSRLFRGGCTQSNVTNWITRHENVHVEKIRRFINRQNINPEMEDLTAFGKTAYQQARERAEARIRRLTRDLGDPEHHDKDYPADPCDLKLLPNP